MGRYDWYQNRDWDPQIEVAFRAKLARSRTLRPQYLIIQAGRLARRHPCVALSLVEEYFELSDGLWISQAHCIQAWAFEAMSMWQEAVAAYKQALAREKVFPNVLSTARLDYPKLVALRKIEHEYAGAMEVLQQEQRESDVLFYNTLYVWNGSYALILHELGRTSEAQELARAALAAASETRSPLPYHPDVGLVDDTSDEFGSRIKRIARPSTLGSFLRLIAKR